VTDKPLKRGRGRPSLTGSPGQRYMVHLPAHVAEYLRASGGGSISNGIIQHIAGMQPARAAKRARARAAKPLAGGGA
jgi:hypothetical protein